MQPILRDDLYERVWREPMVLVAASFGVSSSYLARVCGSLSIPTPPRGYWAKQKHAKKALPRPALPTSLPGDPVVWEAGVALPPPKGEALARNGRRGAMREPAIIRDAREHFERAAKKMDDPLRPASHGYLRPWKQTLLDMTISPATLERGLRVASELIRALEARGHRLVLGPRDREARRRGLGLPEMFERLCHHAMWWPCVPTVAIIRGVGIGVTILEPPHEVHMRRVGNKLVSIGAEEAKKPRHVTDDDYWSIRTTWPPSGSLEIHAYGADQFADWQRSWPVDDKDLRRGVEALVVELEDQVPGIVSGIANAKRIHDEEQRRFREEDRIRREQDEIRTRQLAATKARTQLLELARAWAEQQEMTQFLDAAHRELAEADSSDRARLAPKLALAREVLAVAGPLAVLQRWDARAFEDDAEQQAPS